MLLISLGKFHAQECVRQFLLFRPYLTDIVEETCALRQLRIEAHLCCHGGGELGYFSGVLKEVLSIRRTETHATHHLDQFRVKAMYAEINTGSFADLNNFLFDVFLCLGHHLFDTCRVDTSILN